METKLWKKERGKLGQFHPLLGCWEAETESQRGPLRCMRIFELILGGHYLKLTARWEFGAKEGGQVYEEVALIGVGDDGQVCFWSFTSDGKRSQGVAANVTDLHPEAIGFEAQMPARLARMAYWPEVGGGFHWVVESRTKKGWNRFVDHSYRAVLPAR
jgi:hypothetical protein